jgi:hypothetical protein
VTTHSFGTLDDPRSNPECAKPGARRFKLAIPVFPTDVLEIGYGWDGLLEMQRVVNETVEAEKMKVPSNIQQAKRYLANHLASAQQQNNTARITVIFAHAKMLGVSESDLKILATHVINQNAARDGQYERYGGQVECEFCGLTYNEHPLAGEVLGYEGPFLNRRCDGVLMKL